MGRQDTHLEGNGKGTQPIQTGLHCGQVGIRTHDNRYFFLHSLFLHIFHPNVRWALTRYRNTFLRQINCNLWLSKPGGQAIKAGRPHGGSLLSSYQLE